MRCFEQNKNNRSRTGYGATSPKAPQDVGGNLYACGWVPIAAAGSMANRWDAARADGRCAPSISWLYQL